MPFGPKTPVLSSRTSPEEDKGSSDWENCELNRWIAAACGRYLLCNNLQVFSSGVMRVQNEVPDLPRHLAPRHAQDSVSQNSSTCSAEQTNIFNKLNSSAMLEQLNM